MSDDPVPAAEEPGRQTDQARLEIARLDPAVGLVAIFRRACELAAETLEVERVGVWTFTEDGKALRCANLYERSRGEHSEGATIRVADFPSYFAALDLSRSIPAETAAADSRTAEMSESYLKPLGITSMLDAPIYLGGKVIGVVCHEHTGPPREWTTEARDFAGSVADLLALKMRSAELSDVRAALHTRDEQLAEVRRLEALGQFAAGVAHDFRNLLTVVLGSAELLAARDDLSADARALVGHIADAAGRGAALTTELTGYVRDTARATRVLSAADAVERFLPILRRAVGPSHRVEFARGPNGGSVFIDPSHLERVLLNLVLNARDAMPGGGAVRVSVSGQSALLDPGSPRTYARIEVRDEGGGVPQELIERVFEPFFTTKPAGQGTGLGLAVVKQVVDRAGGFVRVESQPGRGTAFQVFLPRVTADEGDENKGTSGPES
ncbi:MAG TPA: ATP-binding protein [Fimbriiglobus sp.]|nr:ATP-binding protein [Fimbriiglobus sp.]